MVMKILKSLIAGCDLGKKGNVCLANQAILERASFCFFVAKVSSSVILSIPLHYPTAFEQHPKTPNLHPDHYNVLNCASL